jgi:TRAP-type C4-dicarboxylate transport system permease small subunit
MEMWLQSFCELAIFFCFLLALSQAGWSTVQYKSIKTTSANWQPSLSSVTAKLVIILLFLQQIKINFEAIRIK